MQSLGVAHSATDFACPKCGARSFMVLHAHPMEGECLKCGTAALFTVAAGASAVVPSVSGMPSSMVRPIAAPAVRAA
jgi:hypothetical protein